MMGDLPIINALLTTFNENIQFLTRWTGFARTFMAKSTPPDGMDYVGIREIMFEFRSFELRSEAMEKAGELLATVKSQLEAFNYADATWIKIKYDIISMELKIIKCVRVKMSTKLQEHCSILKEVYDMHKEIAAHATKFKQIINAIFNTAQYRVLHNSKDEINELLGELQKFWQEKKLAKQEMDAIQNLEKKIEEVLHFAQLSKVENSHTDYTAKEMDGDWQELVHLETTKGDVVRRQLELYKKGDAACKRFAVEQNAFFEFISTEVRRIQDEAKAGNTTEIERITRNREFTRIMDRKLDRLVQIREYLRGLNIDDNPYLTLTAEKMFAIINEYLQTVNWHELQVEENATYAPRQ